MLESLIEFLMAPWRFSFLVRALIIGVMAGVMCPLLGVYAVTRQFGFMGDALAHSVLPGMVVALWLGLSPYLGAIAASVGMALLIGILMRRTGTSSDTSVGILFAGFFALGLVLLSLSPSPALQLDALLMGQVMATSWSDVAITGILTVIVLVVLVALHRELVFVSFDPFGAAVMGLPTRRLDYILLVLLAVVIVLALNAVGIVLVISLLITPAATAIMLAQNQRAAMALGALMGSLSALLGLYAAYYFNLPPGPAMALFATAFFGLTAIGKSRRTRRV